MSLDAEDNEGCVRLDCGCGHCCKGATANEDCCVYSGSEELQSALAEERNFVAVCKIMNKLVSVKHQQQSFTSTCDCGDLFSPFSVSFKWQKSCGDYLLRVMLYSPTLPHAHVIPGGPQQKL